MLYSHSWEEEINVTAYNERIPVDDQYAALLVKAVYVFVYVFAYYEGTIIWIIERLEAGFISLYCRGNPLTSGTVQKRFQNAINNPLSNFSKFSHKSFKRVAIHLTTWSLNVMHSFTRATVLMLMAYQFSPFKLSYQSCLMM